jgi:hypothetical protein
MNHEDERDTFLEGLYGEKPEPAPQATDDPFLDGLNGIRRETASFDDDDLFLRGLRGETLA